jgi:glycosyltransferase involved in cell wall biosynthesis
MQKILVVIASHGSKNLLHLMQVIDSYSGADIVVTSNGPKLVGAHVKVVEVQSKNPWALTFAHKTIFNRELHNYDLFIYAEDDILITPANIQAWKDISSHLRQDEVAGFFRYELDDEGKVFYPDAHDYYHWLLSSVEKRGPYTIAEYSNKHSGCYMLTQAQLRKVIASGNYLREAYRTARYGIPETAATDPYTVCGLRKVIPISHFDRFRVHHLPNLYVKAGVGEDDKTFQTQMQTLHAVLRGHIFPRVSRVSFTPTKSTHWIVKDKIEQNRFLSVHRFIVRPPQISIGLPVYNGEKYLASAIESILVQDFEDFELIISDNASTDSTPEIIRSFKDKRIRLYNNSKNIGLARNHKRVFELARGEFFKWMAYDDTYHSSFLSRTLDVLKRTDAIAAYTAFNVINEKDNIIRTGVEHVACRSTASARLLQLIRYVGGYTITFALFRSDGLRLTGVSRNFPHSDHIYPAELAVLGVFEEVNEPLLNLRMHAARSCVGYKGKALQRLHDPQSKGRMLPAELYADLKIVQAIKGLPIDDREKNKCILVALTELSRKRILKWTFPVRKRIGLAPSVRRQK